MTTNCSDPKLVAKANDELARRGTKEVSVEITAHALDRASLRVIDLFLATHEKNEGLHTWLARKAEEALAAQPPGKFAENLRAEHEGVMYVFDMTLVIPLLKSVWIVGQKEEDVA